MGFKKLVALKLLPWEEDGLVRRAEAKAALPVETLRAFVVFIHEEANGFCICEEFVRQLIHELHAAAVAALVFV